MQVFTATVTFTNGTAVVLSTIAAFAGIQNFGVNEVYVEPGAANTHVSYLGDNQLALGTSLVNHVIRQLATPVAGAALDSYRRDTKQNVNTMYLTQFAVDGTTAEQMRITVFVD